MSSTALETVRSGPPVKQVPKSGVARLVGAYGLQIFTAVAFIVVGVLVPNFRRLPNLQDIALQSSFSGLAAAGMTLLIVGGVIDLSVAGIIALTAVTLANLLLIVPAPIAMIASLAVGLVLGLVNGLVVTVFRFPPLIADVCDAQRLSRRGVHRDEGCNAAGHRSGDPQSRSHADRRRAPAIHPSCC